MKKINAIFATHPLVVTIRDGVAYDKNENIIEYDESIVQSYINSHSYIENREKEYPPLTDLADALYHQSKGDETKLTAYLAKCEAVKQKYPKE